MNEGGSPSRESKWWEKTNSPAFSPYALHATFARSKKTTQGKYFFFFGKTHQQQLVGMCVWTQLGTENAMLCRSEGFTAFNSREAFNLFITTTHRVPRWTTRVFFLWRLRSFVSVFSRLACTAFKTWIYPPNKKNIFCFSCRSNSLLNFLLKW